MKPEHEGLVAETLGRSLDEIPVLAAELAAEYIKENHTDILEAMEESGFSDYDTFYTTLADSTAYMIMSRCGLDTSAFTAENSEMFRHIGSFDTPKVLRTLGEAASSISENVLREIETVIKKYDMEQAKLAQNERSDIYDTEHSQNTDNSDRNNLPLGGGLPDTRYRDTGGRGETAVSDQVGHDEEGLSHETSTDSLHGFDAFGETVPPLSRDRGTSERPDGAIDETVTGEELDFGGFEENRPDGLGEPDELSESASGGSSQSGIDLQLTGKPPFKVLSPNTARSVWLGF